MWCCFSPRTRTSRTPRCWRWMWMRNVIAVSRQNTKEKYHERCAIRVSHKLHMAESRQSRKRFSLINELIARKATSKQETSNWHAHNNAQCTHSSNHLLHSLNYTSTHTCKQQPPHTHTYPNTHAHWLKQLRRCKVFLKWLTQRLGKIKYCVKYLYVCIVYMYFYCYMDICLFIPCIYLVNITNKKALLLSTEPFKKEEHFKILFR